MAFKTVKAYNEERFGGLFRLPNDGDSADVIFLYRDESDVLIADTHYIRSADYNGYVHCCGKGCPACARKIRVQTKLFIPLYNITDQEIQFWDRSVRFESQLSHDVFRNTPNPSDYIFKITRKGAVGDVNTVYNIAAVATNVYKSYSQILAENNASMSEYYENICKDIDASTLLQMLNSSSSDSSDSSAASLPAYQITPRIASTTTPMAPPADADPTSGQESPSIDSLPVFDSESDASDFEELTDDDVAF